ncbi:cobyrinate a,c-diamide synthase [Oscillospiraceae bacterium MB08-C2-2]|nr:cobyrinate a,c-diamide synthase [Oscillospiraceae bacterium MB08-C2-2]
MTDLPRLLFTASASGTGKTTVTCGFLQALLGRGKKPVSFKCGPDYIDPMFHRRVLGVPGHNLDLFFTSEQVTLSLLAQGAAKGNIGVLEGAMGYYDGLSGGSDTASAWHMAQVTRTPSILVLEPGGMALSAAALVKGFATFRENSGLRGILLNRCEKSRFEALAPVLERETGLPVLGYLPRRAEFAFESRHLGLVTADEVADIRTRLERLAAQLEQSVDISALLDIAASAPPLEVDAPTIQPAVCGSPVIAVARDKAFCFYYAENLSLLEKLGARLAFFSPLGDTALPEGTAALYLGGGYPELYAKQLSENLLMRQAVANAVAAGMPTVAECGGFLYLQASLEDAENQSYPMAGALPGKGFPTGKLGRFGYIALTAKEDSLLLRQGETAPAHEFHYWDSDFCGGAFSAQKPVTGRQWSCGQVSESLYGGFPHLYFWGRPQMAERFVKTAARWSERKAQTWNE